MRYLKKTFIAIPVTLLFSIIFSGCGQGPYGKLDKEISRAIRTNNEVDESEWKSIVAFIESQKDKYADLVQTNGTADIKRLTGYISDFARKHTRRNSAPPVVYTPPDNTEGGKHLQLSFYIDNSISMDGYVKGNTGFDADVTKLLVLSKNYVGQDNLHINFINSKVYPSNEIDIINFSQKLEPGAVAYSVGGKDRRVSDLNKIFRTILDSTYKGKVSVFISDCIYSLGKGGDTEGKLNIQKNLTMDAFLSRLKAVDISTICLKMTSQFTGKYYDYRDAGVSISLPRPYYIWFLGASKDIDEFYHYLLRSSFEEYKNSFVMTYTAQQSIPFFTILKQTNLVGSFNADRSNRDYVHQIEDISYKDGNFQFSLAVDLSKMTVDTSYLLDTRNYLLTEGFVLEKVEKIDRNKLERRDRTTVEKSSATHLFTISSKQANAIRDLNIGLSKQLPAWVASTSCTDDVDIKATSDKTFGFLKLAEGIYQAYITHNKVQGSFFNITVNFKK